MLSEYVRWAGAARWVGTGMSVFLVGGLTVLSVGASTVAANPNSRLDCNPLSINQNTILCGRTKAWAEKYCAATARVTQINLRTGGQYEGASKEHYRVTFWEPTPGGCVPAGTEKVVVEEQLRQGLAGTFKSNGKAAYFNNVPNLPPLHGIIRAGDPRHMNVILGAPYSCATTVAGSAVRPVVTGEWIPAPGWTKAGPTVDIVPGPSQTIC